MVISDPRNANHAIRSKMHQIAKLTQRTNKHIALSFFAFKKIKIPKMNAASAVGICE
jgi:hypothetical protein